MTLGRRSLLLGGAAGLGMTLLGCSADPQPAPPPATTPPAAGAALADVEARFGGRLGVFGVDTQTGATVGHRADERFLMLSTTKVPLSAFVLRRSVDEPGLLESRITYRQADLVQNSPVTGRNVATGMTVADLAAAAITVSDNTAANLLFGRVGGPAAVTGFMRGLGDDVTRFDRIEPALNDSAPGDERDTSTPVRFTGTLRAVTLGDALPVAQRDRLVGWMDGATTGLQRIRAGVPAGWRVGDKTGTGPKGEANDVAVIRPPGRAPVVLTVFTVPDDPANPTGSATIAAATRAALTALGLTP